MSVRKTRKILKTQVSLSDSKASTSVNGSLTSSSPASYKDELEAMFCIAPSIKELRKKAYLEKSQNLSNSSFSKSGSSTPTQGQNSSSKSNLVSSQSSDNNSPVFKKPSEKFVELDFTLKDLCESFDTSSVKSPSRVFGKGKKKPMISFDINPRSLESSLNESSSDVGPNILIKYTKNTAPAGLDLNNDSTLEQSLNETSDLKKLKDRMLKLKTLTKRKSVHLNNASLENTINEPEKEHEIENTSKGVLDLENLSKSSGNGFNLSNDKSVKNFEEANACLTTENNCEDNNNLSKTGANCAEGNYFISTETGSSDFAGANKNDKAESKKPDDEKNPDMAQVVINDKSAIIFGKNFNLDNPELSLDINEKNLDMHKHDCSNDTKINENISNLGKRNSNICYPDTEKLLSLPETYSTESGDSDKPNVNKGLSAKKSISNSIVSKNLSGINTSQCKEGAIETQPENCNDEINSQNNNPPAVVLKKRFSTFKMKGLNDSSFKSIEKSLDSSQLQDQLVQKLRKSAKQKRKSLRLSNISCLVTDEEPVTPRECVEMVTGKVPSDKESRPCTPKEKTSLDSGVKPDVLSENTYCDKSQLEADNEDNIGLVGGKNSASQSTDYSQDNDRNPLGLTFIVSQPCTPSLPVCNTTDTTFTVHHPKRLKCSELGPCINETVDIGTKQCVINNAGGFYKESDGNIIIETNKEDKNEIDDEQSEKNKSIKIPTCENLNNKQSEKNTKLFVAADFDLSKKNSAINNELVDHVNFNKVTSDAAFQDDEILSDIKEPVVNENTLNNDNGSTMVVTSMVANENESTHINLNNTTAGDAKSKEEPITHTENQLPISDNTPALITEHLEETEEAEDCFYSISSQNDIPSVVVLKKQAPSSDLTSLNSSSFITMDKSLNSSEKEDQLLNQLRKSTKQKRKSVRLSNTSLLISNDPSDTSCYVSEVETNEGCCVKSKSDSKEVISNTSELKSTILHDNLNDPGNDKSKDKMFCDNMVDKTSGCVKETRETQEDISCAEISSYNDNSSAIVLKKPPLSSHLTALNDTTCKDMEKSLDTSKSQNLLTQQLRKSMMKKKKSLRLSDASLFSSTRKSNDYNCSEISCEKDKTSGGILKKPPMPSNLIGLNDTTFKNMENSEDITENITENQIIQKFRKSANQKKKSVRLSDASLFVSTRESNSPLCGEIVSEEEPNAHSMLETQDEGITETSSADLQNNISTVNTKIQKVDEQVTALCDNHTEAQDATSKKEDPSIPAVNENQLSEEDPNISEQVSGGTKNSDGALATNAYSVISSHNDLTLNSNDTSLKNNEKSVEISKTENDIRKIVNKKNKSVRLSDTSELVSNRESNSPLCAEIVSEEEPNAQSTLKTQEEGITETSSADLQNDISTVNTKNQTVVDEQVTALCDNHIENTEAQDATSKKEDPSIPAVIENQLSGEDPNISEQVSEATKKTDEALATNTYSVISSHNDLTSADVLKKLPLNSNDTSLKNNEKSVEISKTENEVGKNVNKRNKSVRLSDTSKLVSNRESNSPLCAEIVSEEEPDAQSTLKTQEEGITETSSADLQNNITNVDTKNQMVDEPDLQKNISNVNTKNQTVDEQVTALCDNLIENTEAQDATSKKEDQSIPAVNEKQLSGEDPNISEQASKGTKKTDGALAKNTYSVISSHNDLTSPDVLTKLPLNSNETSLKNNDKSVEISKTENEVRKNVNKKRKSVRLSDTSKLVSNGESNSPLCAETVSEEEPNAHSTFKTQEEGITETSSADLQNNISNVATKNQTVDEQVTTLCDNHTENTEAQDATSKKEDPSIPAVNENQLSGEDPNISEQVSEGTKKTDGALATNAYSVISSLVLKKPLLISENQNDSTMTDLNDSYFKSMDKSLDSSESKDQLMNKLRKSVKQKKISVRLSDTTLLTSKDESVDSSMCGEPVLKSKSNLKKNVNNIDELKSIPEQLDTKDEVPNLVSTENVPKSNINHNESVGNAKSIINPEDKVSESRSIVDHNKTGNITTPNINICNSPSGTKLDQNALRPVSVYQKEEEESPAKTQVDQNDVACRSKSLDSENNAVRDHTLINDGNIPVTTGEKQTCNSDNNVISSVSEKNAHSCENISIVNLSNEKCDANSIAGINQNVVNDISVDEIDTEYLTKPQVHQNVDCDVVPVHVTDGVSRDAPDDVCFYAKPIEPLINLVVGADNENKINSIDAVCDNFNLDISYPEIVSDGKDPIILEGDDIPVKSVFKYPKSSKSCLLQNSRLNENKAASVLGKGTRDIASTSQKEESLNWSIDLSVIQPDKKLPYKLRLRSQSTPLPPKRLKSIVNKSSGSSPKPLEAKLNITPTKQIDKKKPKKSVTFNISSPLESEDGASPPLNTFTDISAIPGEGLRLGGKSKPVSSSPYPPSQRKRKQLKEIADQSIPSLSESRRSRKKNISVQVTKEYISSSSSGRFSQSKSPEQFSRRKQSSFENVSNKGSILHVSNKRKSLNVSNKGDMAHVSHKSNSETVSNKRDSEYILHRRDSVNVSKKEETVHVSHKKDSVNVTNKGDMLNEADLDDSTIAFHPKKKQRIDKSLSDNVNRSKEIQSRRKRNEKTINSYESTARSKHYDSLEDVETQNVDPKNVSKLRRNRALTSITNTVKTGSLRSSSLDSSVAEKSVIFPPKKKARLAEISLEKSIRSGGGLRSFSQSRRNSSTSQLDDSIPLGYSVSDEEQSDIDSIFHNHSWLKPLLVHKEDDESNVTSSGLDLSGDLMPPPKAKPVVKKTKKLAKPAPWANKNFYNFLFDFFKPRYGIEYRKRSEDFVLFLHPYVQSVVLLNDIKDYSPLVLTVKEKTKELGLCTSIWDYQELCSYLPVEFKQKSYFCGSKRYKPVIDHTAPF